MAHKKNQENDIDFEIRFYEGVLNKTDGNFLQVLIALGDLYTKKGLYEKGLSVDRKLATRCPRDPVILYNLACSYSLVNNLAQAYRALKKAVRYGYDNFEHMFRDKDLENLIRDRRFRYFFARLTRRKDSSTNTLKTE